MSISSGSLQGYNLYYAEFQAGTYTKVNSAAIADNGGEDITYVVDVSSLTPGKVYWFKVSAIVDGVEAFPIPTIPTDHTVIRVLYPEANTSLVHRWIANRVLCKEYQRDIGAANGVDVGNHYRCEFNGLGSTDISGTRYYDLGKDLIVDTNEIGCNFSVGACSSHDVGGVSTTDCIGNSSPGAGIQAPQNSVFYSRNHSDSCYIQTSADATSPNWVGLDSMNSSTDIAFTGNNYGETLAAAKVNLPPIHLITLPQAYELCRTQTTDIDNGGVSFNLRKRPLRRKEYAAASVWPSTVDPDTAYNLSRENMSNSCNINDKTVGADLFPGYTDPYWINSASHNRYSGMAIGTSHTSACRSRYGIQDMVGNIMELVTDHIQAFATAPELDMENTTPILDSNFKNDWVNGLGTYLRSSSTNGEMVFSYNSSLNVENTLNRYLNVAMNMFLRCNNGTCATDDRYISHQPAASFPTVINDYRYGELFRSSNNFPFYLYPYDGASSRGAELKVMAMGSAHEYGDGSIGGSRFSYNMIGAGQQAGVVGTRCMANFTY